MALKLFRSTGYESILTAGESRLALHPGWFILLISAWIGFACNVALWRELRGIGPAEFGLGKALLAGAFATAACMSVLSLLGWRRTLKPAATLLVVLAALAACSIWIQAVPVDRNLLDQGFRSLLIPRWTTLLRWQLPAILAVLGLLPALWIWHVQTRRLSGPHQLASNATGIIIGIALMAASGWLLMRG